MFTWTAPIAREVELGKEHCFEMGSAHYDLCTDI